MPSLQTSGLTDVGLIRRNNEDNWRLDEALSIAIVADGMGGAACGEIASALTIEAVMDFLRSPAEPLAPELSMKEAIREANRRVLARARQEPDCKGMGSTIVAALWKLPRVVIANVGDSRAYLWRGGKLAQLSHDQTLVNELRRTLGLTDEQLSSYAPKNVLTMAIGAGEDVLIHTREETLEPGDQILLCSDGLSGVVSDDEIAAILERRETPGEIVQRLIAAAKAAHSEDNITAVLLRYAG
jgi:serine/threonine protein phosphatase PrpC